MPQGVLLRTIFRQMYQFFQADNIAVDDSSEDEPPGEFNLPFLGLSQILARLPSVRLSATLAL